MTTDGAAPYGTGVFDNHARLLSSSAISAEVARERGYVSVNTKRQLADAGFGPTAQRPPGLLIPVWDVSGDIALHQYRPDGPRLDRDGKPRKYETPRGARMVLDVPPGARDRLGSPDVPLWVTEGLRKADSAVSAGLCCVALLGVWNWRGTNDQGGRTALACWESVHLKGRTVYLAFDSDVMLKDAVHAALVRLGRFLSSRGARVCFVYLDPTPEGDKIGLDDYFAAGGTVADLVKLARNTPVTPKLASSTSGDAAPPVAPTPPPARPRTLTEVHEVFVRWLGDGYDTQSLDIVLSVAASERLTGDPVWLLLISGSGNAKTETVCALAGVGAHVHSTISSEGALLSGTSKRDQSTDATGGLLRKIGERGVLVLKDFTSVISMDRRERDKVLAGLREVADGRWSRDVGVDGGRTLAWEGRIVVVGATTSAYDTAHAVVSKMGDRFALVRADSTAGRQTAGRRALRNVGHETAMRAELAEAVRGLFAALRPEAAELTEQDHERLLAAADIVTLCRTGVEHDYRGDVIDAHAPEMPTRFAKMLAQVVRGGLAIGMARVDALDAALRVAHDSIPPLRREVLVDVMDHPGATTVEVSKRLGQPRRTVDRALQELHALRLVGVSGETERGAWRHQLTQSVDRDTLRQLVVRARKSE